MTSRKAPVANQFALGYTYQDVLDADHEGMCVYVLMRIPLSFLVFSCSCAYFTLAPLHLTLDSGFFFSPWDVILYFRSFYF